MRTAVELKIYETEEGIIVLLISGEINITKYFKQVEKPSVLNEKEGGFLIELKEKGDNIHEQSSRDER